YQGRKLERLAAADPRLLVVRSRSDLEALAQRRREDPEVLGALLGIEGANALDGDLASLDRLFAAGLRLVGLAHFFDNEFAGSAHGLEKGGLTDLGRRLVAEIGRRGLVLDLAHSSEATFRDALALARRPPVVSHTGVKGTCPNPRNLSDDQVRAVAAAGGVIGIGYWETAVCGTGIADIVRAMRHVALLVGDDHVGLGSDFDGAVATPFDTAGLASLTQALLDGGFEDDSVRKILGENALRVIGESLPR
ncbi:MAG: membrane dipeptidase, partial [Chloroflexi bacterium]|nr:membrane dipeptidase [Chloroflexota bacterium]